LKKPGFEFQTASSQPKVSRGAFTLESVASNSALGKMKRAQGMPGDGLTHGPPATKKQAAVTTGGAGSTGIPCAMVLTVSFVLFPMTMLGCHRHPQGARCAPGT